MYQVYQAGSGETLNSIAKKFDISIDELMSINNELSNNILPGMLIVVPSINDYFIKYTINKGDSLYSIAQKYNTMVDDISLLNGINKNDYIYPGEILLIPKSNIKIYITKDGTTIKDLDLLGNLNDVFELNSKIYLLPNQIILYKKES